jgi:hypothetical protein
MIRRALLRALGGALAVSPMVKAKAGITDNSAGAYPYVRSISAGEDVEGEPIGNLLGSKERRGKNKLYRALTERDRRAERRTERMLALTNGWPPGVACMESNALWFRAHVAERQIEAKLKEHRSLIDAIYTQVYGEG